MAIFLATFFAPLFLILGMVAYFNKQIQSTGHPKLIFTAVVLVMVGWMMFAMTRLMRRPWYASAFRRELCRRGHPVCISCGYWLRGLNQKSKHCPECGKPLRRHRRRRDSRHPVKYKARRGER